MPPAGQMTTDHRPQTTLVRRRSSVVGRRSSGTTRALIQGRSAGRRHRRVVLGTYPIVGAGSTQRALPPSQAWATTPGAVRTDASRSVVSCQLSAARMRQQQTTDYGLTLLHA